MANTLTCEIIESMSGIKLDIVHIPPSKANEFDLVCGEIVGEAGMTLRFEAEQVLFCRMARNMIGDEPEDVEEVKEYAAEIFNVLCGRFVSELCNMTQAKLRFNPPRYLEHSDRAGNCDQMFVTLYFLTDMNEILRFSWSKGPVEDLLKESVNI